ncbi:MAG: sterol desaturase family protein, partial [Saprospiraceae bacterium]|nr:sterol desaturase family protein [Saprospiraceae bacterium]
MQEYARILNYAIPFFIVLIVIEYGASCLIRLKVNRLFDTVSSLSSGITNVLKDILGLSIIIISYGWMADHLALIRIESSVALYVLAFIGLDFAGYWSHRFSHEINILWNRHIIHHSSEEYNLACALRQSVSEIFAVFTILFLPMALLGVPPKIVGFIAPLHLFAQFWYHTRLIGKMGILEYILVTPSHHRVHHAINPKYMDKNYSQIFIVWDKLFGTF